MRKRRYGCLSELGCGRGLASSPTVIWHGFCRNARRGKFTPYIKTKAFFFGYFLLSPNKRKYEIKYKQEQALQHFMQVMNLLQKIQHYVHMWPDPMRKHHYTGLSWRHLKMQ